MNIWNSYLLLGTQLTYYCLGMLGLDIQLSSLLHAGAGSKHLKEH